MTPLLAELHERRARLVERAGTERARLASYAAGAESAGAWLEKRAVYIGAGAALVGFLVGPRRIAGLAARGWTLWQLVAGLRKLWH